VDAFIDLEMRKAMSNFNLTLVDDGTTTYLVVDPGYVEKLIEYLTKMKFMLRVDVRDASSEFVVLRAPGIADAIGGPYALVPTR